MSRSGYSDVYDEAAFNLYRGTVNRVLRSKRGQAFLRELAAAMDAMPEKILIAEELIDERGDCCAIGVVCKSRKIDVSKVDYECAAAVGNAVNIAPSMAAEIEYQNDKGAWHWKELPAERWTRMRKWVAENLKEATP